MRLVHDTNVVASGLLWNGVPARLMEAAELGDIELFTSRRLLAELTRILRRAKFNKAILASGFTLDELVIGYAELAQIVVPSPIAATIIADPDDDHVLACASTAQVNLIVTGDNHLHALGGAYRGIDIVTPALALQRIQASG